MLLYWTEINQRHSATSLCARGAEQKCRILAEEEEREGATLAFKEYGQPLTMVSLFRYLGRTLKVVYDNCTAVVTNLWKAQKAWYSL